MFPADAASVNENPLSQGRCFVGMHSATIKIPEVAELALRQKPQLDAFVRTALFNAASYISSNRLEFFPEYTEHDTSHIQSVIETCYELTTPDSLSVINQSDHAIIIISALLHDLGMHITIDGFYTLISEKNCFMRVRSLDKKSWPELWEDYLQQARRFDERQLTSLFGENFRPVSDLPSEPEPLDDFHRLLVGDFLRRHHHILAHHIALYGIPAKNGTVIKILPNSEFVEAEIIDLSGLVARSHGMHIRETFEYLQQMYDDHIAPRQTHPVFAMALLRTSDYLQIQKERAPLPRTLAVSLRSSISRREWRLHQCVRGLRRTIDPETIVVDADPKDIESFARLRWWLDDVQRELDTTWAVLGEVYGLQHHNRLNRLGLNIRRVRSNLDDTKKISKRLDFLPEEIRIRAANDELLKGLVGPLYGDYPGAGIRELVQNAADAVLEAEDIFRSGSVGPMPQFWNIDADIQVEITKSNSNAYDRLIITDRGVGMTLDTVKNYFLNVGASYRNSKEWRELHDEGSAASGRLRSGRFGVGVLAAFALELI
ncbi:HD domain-containing protein (plasmid) [Rhodobacter capsulatus]